MDSLMKKLNELKELLKSKSPDQAQADKKAKFVNTLKRRRGDDTVSKPMPSTQTQEKRGQENKAAKEMENKIRNDKTFKDAALRHNKLESENKQKKKAIEVKQNKGYDEAVDSLDGANLEVVGTKKRRDNYINQMDRRKNAGVNKLINRESRVKKSLREKLEDLKKAMNNSGIGGAGAVKAGNSLPSINKMPKPGNNSLATSVGIPGQASPSKTNPVKAAEQTQNKDIKDMKMKEAQAALKTKGVEMVKFEKNGQWSIKKPDDKAPTPWPLGKPKTTILDDPKYTGPNYKDKPADKPKEKLDKSDVAIFQDNGQWSLEKSGYKGYNTADNARRKSNNLGEGTEIKSMPRIKEYGNSASVQAAQQAVKDKAKSKKNPVKVMTGDSIPQELRDKYEKKGKS